MNISKTLYVTNRDDWRTWLTKNHKTEKEIWLIYYKKHTGIPRISYDEAVEEALCLGWIDSLIQKIDEEKYAQKFTPRTNNNKWSESNINRMKKLIKEGRMTKAGLIKIDKSELKKKNTKSKLIRKEVILPKFLKNILSTNKKALENFEKLAPSYKRLYIGWIIDAKKEDTQLKRLTEAMGLLEKNKKLGMK
jgi:uncharacterized protein YdeI (YjbR/CyaY-like superfamily)